MANRLICGFEAIQSADLAALFYDVGGSSIITNVGGDGFSGIRHLQVYNNWGLSFMLPDGPATIIDGFRMSVDETYASTAAIKVYFDGATSQVTLAWVATGTPRRLKVLGAGGALLATGTHDFKVGEWNYIEVKIVSHPSAGSVVVRVNGKTDISVSGVNTAASGAGRIDRVRFGDTGIRKWWFDDWYINDGAGAEHNDFEGDIAVLATLPSGPGSFSALTPTPAVANWENVDDALPDGDTSYNTGDTAGQKDSYAVAPVANLRGHVRVVQATAIVRKDDAGLREMRALIRSGAQEVPGQSLALNTSWAAVRATAEADPATGLPWEHAAVGAAEIGVEVVS